MPTPTKQTLEYDVSYKTLLLGESGVGKTCLINQLMKREFKNDLLSTIGIDFVKRVFDIDGTKVLLEIWDTAGQERFRSITRFQYRGTKGLLLVYDITNSSTFDMLKYWLQSIKVDLDKDNEEPVPVFLLGNKKDLTENRHISYSQGRKEADKHFLYGFEETSAKTGENVEESFRNLAQKMLEIHHPDLAFAPKPKEATNCVTGSEQQPVIQSEDSPAKPAVKKKTRNQNMSIKLTAKKASDSKKCSACKTG